MTPIRILLVDDHIPTREQVSALLCAQPDINVIDMAGSAEEALDKEQKLHPDVVVMDIMLPGMNGIEAARHILLGHPEARILALSNHSGPVLIQAVFDAGCLGYVRKNRAHEELISAVRMVSAGQRYTGSNSR